MDVRVAVLKLGATDRLALDRTIGGGTPPVAAPTIAPPAPTSSGGSVIGDLNSWATGFHPDAGLTGAGPNGLAGNGSTDYSGFINATVGPPPGSTTPNAPVWGPSGPPPVAPPPPGPPQGPPSSPFDSDPGYASARAAEQLGIPSTNNNLNNLIAQRIVAYGDPSFAAQAGFGLDPQAAAFARQNYLSGNGQLARLDKAHEQARRTIINTLAAHGLLDSGDTGYQIGQADQGYGNQVYDAQQQALADILGYRNNAQAQRDALHNATVAAGENAFTNYSNNPAAYGQVAATPPPVTTIPPLSAASKKQINTPTVPKAVVKALRNPYTTGQKRFG